MPRQATVWFLLWSGVGVILWARANFATDRTVQRKLFFRAAIMLIGMVGMIVLNAL
jgi:hypothetical protein